MKLYFSRMNGPADEAIDRLIELAGNVKSPELIREMILTALKAGQEEKKDKADLKLMNSALKEMRYTSKVFGSYRHIRKVTVFGSARVRNGEPLYELAKGFGGKVAEAGYMVITGGGPGIMQAINEGAGRERSFGVKIRLPFEQRPNPVLEGLPRLITYKYFFSRKVAFIREAHAVVLFPGGFGTLDEAMETLTLVQTGKRDPVPVLLFDEPGGAYWPRLLKFFKQNLLNRGYIDPTDFNLFEPVDSADDAVERIRRFYRRYHSLRYVDGKLVIRLTSSPDFRSVGRLKDRFSDILTPGGDMYLSGPLDAEADDLETADLPRIVLDFNHKSFGRLRSFIGAVNED